MTQQGSGEDIRPADEIRADLVVIEERISGALEEGRRKLKLAENHESRLERPAYGEECVRLRDDVIEPLKQAKNEAVRAVDALDAGKINAAQAQKALETFAQALEDGGSTIEDVGLEKLDDEEEQPSVVCTGCLDMIGVTLSE